MSNSLYTDALATITMGLAGEEDPGKYLATAGQIRAVANLTLAKRMRPNREAWEKLGFEFTDIEGDRLLVKAVLPEGWTINKSPKNYYFSYIFDEKGRARAEFFYAPQFWDRDAHMELITRFKDRCHYSESNDGKDSKKIIYFGSEDEELFVAGVVEWKSTDSDEVKMENYLKEEELWEAAKKWGNEHYPNWRDIDAYWDDDLEQEDTHEEGAHVAKMG